MLNHVAIGHVVYSWKYQRSCGSDISSCKNEQKKKDECGAVPGHSIPLSLGGPTFQIKANA